MTKKKDDLLEEDQPPQGTSVEDIDLGGGETLIHVTWPSFWPVDVAESVKVWADTIKKSFARKKIKIICSVEDIKINVIRPRTVKIKIANSVIEEHDFISKLQEALRNSSISDIVFDVDNITIKKKGRSK